MVGGKFLVAGLATVGCLWAVQGHAVTLNEAIQQALKSNPEVRIETNELLARGEEVNQAKAGYKPELNLAAGIGFERSDNNSTRALGLKHRDLTRKEASLTMRQMLFDGFATRSEVERQSARVESTTHRIDGVSQNKSLEAVDAYLNVLRHNKLLDLSKENLRAHDRVYDQVELRSEAGIGRNSDLEQVRGRRASANANRLSDIANLKDAESSYLFVVGTLPKELEAAPKVDDVSPASLKEAVGVALKEHPTLLSAKADVRATLAQHQAARHTYYPRFDLEVGTTWGDDQDGTKGEERDITAMIRMNYNLFAGGKDEAREKQTIHLINEAKEVRNHTYRQVVGSLRLSWTSFQATKAQLASLRQHLVSSEKTRDAYAKQFNLGKRTLLDLLNTENEVFQAKRSFADAEYDHLFAQYRILVGTGRLLGHLGISSPRGEGSGDSGLEPYAEIAPLSLDEEDFYSDPSYQYQE